MALNNLAKQEEQSTAVNEKITTRVLTQIEQLRTRGRLHIPPDYSAENALNLAYPMLVEQGVIVNGKVANVTEVSVANALQAMVIRCFNPLKHTYFVVRGNKLCLDVKYTGNIYEAERLCPGQRMYYGVVYQGDIFEIKLVRGRMFIDKHEPGPNHLDLDKITHAFAGMEVTATGHDLGCTVMTIDQIRTSWKKSQTYKNGDNKHSFHTEQADIACIRTVTRRHSKMIVQTSGDDLLMEQIRLQEIESVEADIEAETDQYANSEVLTIPAAAVDETTGEVSEPEQKDIGF
jgi:recombinational DNA repair protein RecT